MFCLWKKWWHWSGLDLVSRQYRFLLTSVNLKSFGNDETEREEDGLVH